MLLPWVEKQFIFLNYKKFYSRPNKLEDVSYQDDVIKSLQGALANGNVYYFYYK